jgi:hypothetical protein
MLADEIRGKALERLLLDEIVRTAPQRTWPTESSRADCYCFMSPSNPAPVRYL